MKTRRDAIITTAAAGLLAADRSWGAARGRQPNILFILADDLGYADISCNGQPSFQTPVIDSLAGQGLSLTQAYANSAVCSASRTALITGRYQYRLPVGLEEPIPSQASPLGLPPSHPTLPSLLKAAGYQTALFGKWHLGAPPDHSPLNAGYEHFFGFAEGAIGLFHASVLGGKARPL